MKIREIRFFVPCRFSAKYNAHTNPLFQNLKLLKVEDIKNTACVKFYYKYLKNELPRYFDNMFDKKYLSHDHGTRNKNKPILPTPKKDGAKSALRFSLLPIIDSLPIEITQDL